MRDEDDGTRIPTRLSPIGTIALTACLLAATAVAAIGQDRHPFPSCEAATTQPGVSLPLTPADPGWNPALDSDRDGRAC